MTLQFSETSPGVHMASWEHPKTGVFRTVVIIESLGSFTLYIDSEVVSRDLASLELARSRAEQMLVATGSRKVVVLAGALVGLAIIGGAGVGLSKLVPAVFNSTIVEPATAAPAASTRAPVAAFNAVGTRAEPTIRPQPRPTARVVTVVPPETARVATGDAASGDVTAVAAHVPPPARLPAPRSTVSEAVTKDRPMVPDVAGNPATALAAEDRVFSAARPVFSTRRQPVADVAVGIRKSPRAPAAAILERTDKPGAEPVTTTARNLEAMVSPTGSARSGHFETAALPAGAPAPQVEPAAFSEIPLPERNPIAAAEIVALGEAPLVPADDKTWEAEARTGQVEFFAPVTGADAPGAQTEPKQAKRRTATTKSRRSNSRRVAEQARRATLLRSRTRASRSRAAGPRRIMRCHMGGCGWAYSNRSADSGRYGRQHRLY